MQLTAQQFGEVLESLRGGSRAGGGSEKRRFVRTEVQARVVVATLLAGTPGRCYSALTRDLSFGGIGLIQALAADLSDRLLVRLPCGSKPPLMIVCVVVHYKTLADGIFGVGAEFVAEAGPDMVGQLDQVDDREMRRIRNSILG